MVLFLDLWGWNIFHRIVWHVNLTSRYIRWLLVLILALVTNSLRDMEVFWGCVSSKVSTFHLLSTPCRDATGVTKGEKVYLCKEWGEKKKVREAENVLALYPLRLYLAAVMDLWKQSPAETRSQTSGSCSPTPAALTYWTWNRLKIYKNTPEPPCPARLSPRLIRLLSCFVVFNQPVSSKLNTKLLAPIIIQCQYRRYWHQPRVLC